MTTVRIACAEPNMDTRPDGSPAIAHIVVVLADDPGHRAMRLWLCTRQGMALWRILERLPRGGEAGQSSGLYSGTADFRPGSTVPRT